MHSKSLIQNSLIFISIFLLGLGIVMIYSSSSIFAAQKFHDSAYFLKKQVLFGICGIMCMFVTMRMPYFFFKKLAYPLWLGSIVLLVLVLVPGIGIKVGGAVRWLRFGPLSFQPAELAKLTVIILLSYSLAKKEHNRINNFSIGVLPHLILVIPVCSLIFLQPDFGTAMMFIGLLFIMLFVAGISTKYLAILSAMASMAAMLLIISKGYRLERILAFIDPWKNATDTGYHIIQSFLAFGSGGLLGTGLGRGTQKLFYLPEPHTDFILSVIGEELGFLGVLLVIVLFIVMVICGIKIATHAHDLFGTYMALGISILIGFQAVINMGVVMGLLPTKGIPLPFISYGGSSLLINLIGVGILLSISTQCNIPTQR
jgi:cell division protein FtsW